MSAATWKRCWLPLLLAGAFACGDDDGSTDVGRDAGMDLAAMDTGALDTGVTDMRASDGAVDMASDAAIDAAVDMRADGSVDASMDGTMEVGSDGALPREGFGTIFGECGRLAAEFASPEASFYSVRLDFADDGYDEPEERPLLTPDAVTLLEAGTAGGSSEISEAFALEVLVRCEGAMLSATETEITYDPSESAKTDFRAFFGDAPIGVSVVRAFSFPLGSDYPVSEANRILRDKLADILESSANVTDAFAWDKQILAVLAPDDMPLESVETAWEALGDDLRADTILFVIVTDGEDEAVYLNR